MQRIHRGRWLIAGLIVAAAFMGCAVEKRSSSDQEPLDRVTQATSASGFRGTTITEACGPAPGTQPPPPLAQFDELNLHAHNSGFGDGSAVPANWDVMLKTKGQTSLFVLTNTWAGRGSQTGWHTHPGPSLVTVTEGTLAVYDESCVRREFSAPTAGANPGANAFVDVGGGDVHLVRNEGQGEAKAIVVQFVPAGGVRRIDVPPTQAPTCDLPVL
jgi:quercetin dioxygenase-like cupin family protein